MSRDTVGKLKLNEQHIYNTICMHVMHEYTRCQVKHPPERIDVRWI